MKYFPSIFFILTLSLGLALALSLAPRQARAESMILIDCKYGNIGKDGKAVPIPNTNPAEYECGFGDIIAEINKLVNFAFLLAVPVTMIALTWAGIKILLAAGNMTKVTEAKKMATQVLTGFLFVLCAWLIVYVIASNLLKEDYYTQFIQKP